METVTMDRVNEPMDRLTIAQITPSMPIYRRSRSGISLFALAMGELAGALFLLRPVFL